MTATPSAPYPRELVQELVDRAVPFNFYAGASGRGRPMISRSGSQLVGVELDQDVHLLDIEMAHSARELRAGNTLRGPVGRLAGRLALVPWGARVLPDRAPPEQALDPHRSQRLLLQDLRLSLDAGASLRLFGTGRTLPAGVDGKPRLLVAANAVILEGGGSFSGMEGFCSFGGEMDLEQGGFVGSLFLRLLDTEGRIAAPTADDGGGARQRLASDFTYVNHQVTKGDPSIREPNWFSLGPDGKPRSICTPVFLRDLQVRTTLDGAVRSHRQLGPVIARERGLGIPTEPDQPGSGGLLKPIPFQGFAEDIFFDGVEEVGRIHINWLEGNVTRLQFPEIPGQLTRLFGFYGFIVRGTGVFAGLSGIVHGSGGGALDPPLDVSDQAFDNYYIMQLNDPRQVHRSDHN